MRKLCTEACHVGSHRSASVDELPYNALIAEVRTSLHLSDFPTSGTPNRSMFGIV